MSIIDARERFHVPEFSLADRLAKARHDAGITQERMGELLGCSRRTIVRYETAARIPRSVVLAYHVATQTDLGWLETGSAEGVHPLGLEPRTHCFSDGHLAAVVDISEFVPSKWRQPLVDGQFIRNGVA